MTKANCSYCGKPTTTMGANRKLVGTGEWWYIPMCSECKKIYDMTNYKPSFESSECISCEGTGRIKGYKCCSCNGTGKK